MGIYRTCWFSYPSNIRHSGNCRNFQHLHDRVAAGRKGKIGVTIPREEYQENKSPQTAAPGPQGQLLVFGQPANHIAVSPTWLVTWELYQLNTNFLDMV